MWLRFWGGVLICLLMGIAPLTGSYVPNTSHPQEQVVPVGKYTSPQDGSTLILTEQADGTFHMIISLYRLTMQDDGVGTYQDGQLIITATDASGQPMTWHIFREGNIVKAVVASSTWALLPTGECFEFE